ncbi:MAG: tetratricopeptide repeat protein [Chthoniobacterales bacterium]
MKIRKIATITLLVLSSLAANSVAPSKTELEAMYDKAFREFDANHYAEALKDLDAIDARQPDLAESQNLRGVILMRQKDYANAETALQKALAADPKFWNARFNLAEVPFLRKDWSEARKRFQELLNSNASELQGEATQLIQYKILITYLLEGKENMVSALIAKFELAPETPAVQYANAAVALNKKDEPEAKKWLTTAGKNFSPQLNKLFAESLYEVGWLEKPAGQTRAALELNSAAERAAQAKSFAQAKLDQAEQALQQPDLTAARKLVDEADAADPNQPAVLNLRGEVMLEQKDFDGAESEFRKAAKLDPKFRDAQYNLAQIPFKKKEYTKARERFEQLFSSTSGADKDRAAQLIKFKIYLTFLLEGKDSRAQKMMEQFQFTGDTPALYYAQAAWEFKHDNAAKANEWVTSARKIYPLALNGVFAESFFDLGWLQSPAIGASPAPQVAETGQPEAAPSIEPTPIASLALAQNTPARTDDPLALAAQANAAVPGMEATTSKEEQSPAASSALAPVSSPKVETPVASTASPAAARPVNTNPAENSTERTSIPVIAAASASPATVLAPAEVRDWSNPSLLDQFGSGAFVIGAMLLAAILLLAFTVISTFRRRTANASSSPASFASASAPQFKDVEGVSPVEQLVAPTRLAGGPPQVSLQLRASEPAIRRAAMPLGKSLRPNSHGYANDNSHAQKDEVGADYGSSSAEITTALDRKYAQPETVGAPEAEPLDGGVGESMPFPPAEDESLEGVGEPILAALGSTHEEFAPAVAETVFAPESRAAHPAQFNPEPAFTNAPVHWDESVGEPVAAAAFASAEEFQSRAAEEPMTAPAAQIPAPGSAELLAASFASDEEDLEPIGQGQPIPYLTPAPIAESSAPTMEEPVRASFPVVAADAIGAAEKFSVDMPASAPTTVPSEPSAQQPTTPATMPQPTQATPAPAIRTAPLSPAAGAAAPQPASAMQPAPQAAGGGMHTAVQLTFSFEIASLQLTPNFKMGSLQLRPTSKIVTMRLASSQQPQPAVNLQVTFEIATVQAGNSLGVIRLTPSQQQRPSVVNSPSFNIAGLQLVSGSDAAPVQLTPSQQGQASVLVTAAFQIATVEFSPSFEIASIILNSTSRNVNVQLPGTGPSAVEDAPVFEIANVQVAGTGDIGMMQLNPRGAGAAAPATPAAAPRPA